MDAAHAFARHQSLRSVRCDQLRNIINTEDQFFSDQLSMTKHCQRAQTQLLKRQRYLIDHIFTEWVSKSARRLQVCKDRKKKYLITKMKFPRHQEWVQVVCTAKVVSQKTEGLDKIYVK